MINIKILKLASNTKYFGLKNNYTHKCIFKNKKCGDKISLEIIVRKNKICSMRYETNSCIYSQASASILANSINIFNKDNLIENIKILNSNFVDKKLKLPLKLKKFQYLFNKKNINRMDCIMLPFNALAKAIR
tara:strand:- start:7 stop:405 length:399 start_codon:yes stop_codon:yes gene_type:complete